MKKVFDIITWSLLSFLLIPSGLVLASWNSVPGDPLYTVKLGLERSLLAVVPSSTLQSSLQMKYTEWRFNEAEQVLDTDLAVQGLNGLDQQLVATTLTISQVKNAQEQARLADSYIKTLTTVNTKLEEKRQTIASVPVADQSAQNSVFEQQPPTSLSSPTTVALPQARAIPTPTQNTRITSQITPSETTQPQRTPRQSPTQPPASTTRQPEEKREEMREQISETQRKIAEEIRHMEEIKREAQKNQEERKNSEDRGREEKSSEKKDRMTEDKDEKQQKREK